MAMVSLIDEHRLVEQGRGRPRRARRGPRPSLDVRPHHPRRRGAGGDRPGPRPALRDYPFVAPDGGVRFYAGQPLHAPGGARSARSASSTPARRSSTRTSWRSCASWPTSWRPSWRAPTSSTGPASCSATCCRARKPDLPGYEVAGVCLPASAVGGDFFDWHCVGDDFQVVIADVMGKGIPAAIIGASVRSLMRGRVPLQRRRDGRQPGRRRDRVRPLRDLDVRHPAGRPADPPSGTLTYVDAGPRHRRDRHPRRQGPPVRVRRSAPRRTRLGAVAGRAGVLEPGDTFVALSDGALDLFETIEEAREATREPSSRPRDPQEVVDIVAAYARPPRHRRRHLRRDPPPRALTRRST